jgi:sensor domain CHASE-containing protein
MIITVSDLQGVKQYDVSDNIKKIVILFLVVITLIIAGLAYSIKTSNGKLYKLEKSIIAERIVEKKQN